MSLRRVINMAALFIVCCTAAGLAAYLSVMAVTESAPEVVLPELEGKDLVVVLETLTGLGLNTKLSGSDFSGTVPRNHILFQDPEPGAIIRKGRDVMIRLSSGPRTVTTPALALSTLQKADVLLETGGLTRGSVSTMFSDTVPSGGVIAQAPLPGTVVDRLSRIDLLVSQGRRPRTSVVPNLVGLFPAQAETWLSQRRLELSQVRPETNPAFPDNAVIGQEPPAGDIVPERTPVILTVNVPHSDKSPVAGPISGVIPVCCPIAPGFLNKQVTIEADLFGTTFEMFNDFVKPGTQACVLIPGGAFAEIRFIIDQTVVKTHLITPWQHDQIPGESQWQ